MYLLTCLGSVDWFQSFQRLKYRQKINTKLVQEPTGSFSIDCNGIKCIKYAPLLIGGAT